MKVTLDLTALREAGEIDQAEFDKLLALAARTTGSLAFNILIGFGVIAVSGAALALIPTPFTALMLGVVIAGGGLFCLIEGGKPWVVLANICLLAGALMFGGGLVLLLQGSVEAFLLVAAIFAGVAVLARSGLLAAGAVLALGAALGARGGYFHATYMLRIEEPVLTVVLFSAVALGLLLVSRVVRAEFANVALIGARTAAVMVNLGFWIGSLWGDRLEFLMPPAADGVRSMVISPLVFSIAWAMALIGVGIWGASVNRRWVVNAAAVFGVIHFYTQWFERLGATPLSVLLAGLLALGIALALRRFNQGHA
jgi:hypothetical protein